MHRSQFNDRQYKLSCQVTLPTPKNPDRLSWFTSFTSSIRQMLAEGRSSMVVSSMADHFHCLRSECCWGKPVWLETGGQRRSSPTRSRGGLQSATNRKKPARSYTHKGQSHEKISLIRYWPKFVGLKGKPSKLSVAAPRRRKSTNPLRLNLSTSWNTPIFALKLYQPPSKVLEWTVSGGHHFRGLNDRGWMGHSDLQIQGCPLLQAGRVYPVICEVAALCSLSLTCRFLDFYKVLYGSVPACLG